MSNAELIAEGRKQAIGYDILVRLAGQEIVHPNIVTRLADALEASETDRLETLALLASAYPESVLINSLQQRHKVLTKALERIRDYTSELSCNGHCVEMFCEQCIAREALALVEV